MSVKEKLLEIVGSDYFSDDLEVLKRYSKDQSLSPPGMPNYVVKSKDSKEVQGVIRLTNEYLLPVVPVSSKIHFYGDTIPRQGV